MAVKIVKKNHLNESAYSHFEQLDGNHPWMKVQPSGFVAYRVRELGEGAIAYFNFVLAKEMGLIPAQHPHEMTLELKQMLLKTFSLQIINEYDELTKRKIDPKTIKTNLYMASRYLQLQHQSKVGKTSGDGRGIWNGVVRNRGKIWDVSSRGTGVTCLAPGSVEANRPLKTGAGQFGYGCGQAEVDELFGAAILAEIMHLQGVPTERVLCIIDLKKGFGIGVRAAPNLLRPAHLFLYHKQNRYEDLKRGLDYFIDRQITNGRWKPKTKGLSIYDEFADKVSSSFAEFTAKLDIDYIFAWLDWDGDNVLADPGIIDYGSVRQFGIRHDRYRYDDIERFSTNLNEQRRRARLIVQVFAQMAEFIKTKKKKPLREFNKHHAVLKFDKEFSHFRTQRLLFRMGFNEPQRTLIIKEKKCFDTFDRVFSYFERAKISGSMQKVADGVNQPALFNMRNILREYPKFLASTHFASELMNEEVFFKSILSTFAKARDTSIRPKHRGHIQNFQRLYKQMVTIAANGKRADFILPSVCKKAQRLNLENRITGNALIQIVDEILTSVRRGTPVENVQKIIDQIIRNHLDFPEVNQSRFYDRKPQLLVEMDLFQKILNLVERHCEDI